MGIVIFSLTCFKVWEYTFLDYTSHYAICMHLLYFTENLTVVPHSYICFWVFLPCTLFLPLACASSCMHNLQVLLYSIVFVVPPMRQHMYLSADYLYLAYSAGHLSGFQRTYNRKYCAPHTTHALTCAIVISPYRVVTSSIWALFSIYRSSLCIAHVRTCTVVRWVSPLLIAQGIYSFASACRGCKLYLIFL